MRSCAGYSLHRPAQQRWRVGLGDPSGAQGMNPLEKGVFLHIFQIYKISDYNSIIKGLRYVINTLQ